MRIFLAVLLGAIAMFIWSAIAHMMLPLGEAGLRDLPNDSVLKALQNELGDQAGLYPLPSFGLGPNPTGAQRHEAMQHLDERVAKYPSGLLMYFPAGSRPLAMGRWLAVEFGAEFLESLLVVVLLSRTRLTSFGGRVGFVFLAGVLAAIATNISYWNWYGFPTTYTVSYMAMQIIGFLCLGLVAGLVLKKHQFAN
jgi:hypothetical protein